MTNKTIDIEQARAAKKKLLQQFNNVSGISAGITRSGNDYAVSVNISNPGIKITDIPKTIDDVKVVTNRIGKIVAR